MILVMAGLGGSIKVASKIFSQTPEQIRDEIIQQGYTPAESVYYIVKNRSEAIQYFSGQIEGVTKGGVSYHSGSRIGELTFKGLSDWSRGDIPCTFFCFTSGFLELISGVYVWVPFAPKKIFVLSVCKSTSLGLTKFRDLCAAGHTKFC